MVAALFAPIIGPKLHQSSLRSSLSQLGVYYISFTDAGHVSWLSLKSTAQLPQIVLYDEVLTAQYIDLSEGQVDEHIDSLRSFDHLIFLDLARFL